MNKQCPPSQRAHLPTLADGTFEEIEYSMGTTVRDVIDQVSAVIQLTAHQTFGLFATHSVTQARPRVAASLQLPGQ